MKKIAGDKPIGVPCVATFISNKQKCHVFLFSSTQQENRRVEQVLGEGGGWH
jgi:hypothetical protein